MSETDQTTPDSPAPAGTTPDSAGSTARPSDATNSTTTPSGPTTADETTSGTATVEKSTIANSTDAIDSARPVPTVDPRAPRFGQGLTASLLGVAIVRQSPWLVALVALILTIAVASRWRIDPAAMLWRRAMVPLLGPPHRTEPAAPHRFAKLIGATFTIAATPLVVLGGAIAVPGYALAGVVAVLAGLAATTGFCLGCRLYGQLALARRLNLV